MPKRKDADDQLVLQTQQALLPIFIQWPVTALLVFGFIGLIAFQFRQIALLNLFYAGIALLLLGTIAVRFIQDLIDQRLTVYTLTRTDLTEVRGGLTRRTRTIPLDKIQSISTRQPLLGQLLNYGSVGVTTAGYGTIRLYGIQNPQAWEQTLHSLTIGR